MDFNGKYLIKIQAKNQVVVPAKLRDDHEAESEFPRVFYLFSKDLIGSGSGDTPSRRITLYPVTVWNDMVQKMEERLRVASPKDASNKIKLLRSSVEKIELDPQNRFTFSKEVLDATGIDEKEVYFAGSGKCIDIWQKTAFEAFVSANQGSLKESVDGLFDEL